MPSIHSLNTSRITAIPAREDHVAVIEQVLRENHATCVLLSAHPDSHAEALNMVVYSELPPHGIAENLRNFVLRERESATVMGILSLYLGYPHSRACYIGSLFLRPSWQGDGHGQEIVQELERQLRRQGYTESRVAVGLKNWPALRFWTKHGYDTVSMISGDRTFAADHYAVIEFQKDLGAGARNGGCEEWGMMVLAWMANKKMHKTTSALSCFSILISHKGLVVQHGSVPVVRARTWLVILGVRFHFSYGSRTTCEIIDYGDQKT